NQEMLDRGTYDLLRKMLADRDDYLFYKTPIFSEEETIIGPITATIYASTSAVDTDWYMILVALDKDNKFVDIISVGIVSAKFRNSLERPALVEKDKVIQYDFDMDHYGLKLKKGQKMGLIVTSSFGYPFLAKNLNTGENNQITTDYKIAEQKIYHTKEYKSYISVPILNKDIDN